VFFNFVKLLQQRLHSHHMLNKLLTLRALCLCLSFVFVCPRKYAMIFLSRCAALLSPPIPPPLSFALTLSHSFIHTLQMKRAQLCDATWECMCVCAVGGPHSKSGLGLASVLGGGYTHTHTQASYKRKWKSFCICASLLSACTYVCVCVSNGIF